MMLMRTVKLTLAYDGTAYAGWQVQPARPTIQQTLEQAIAAVTGETVRVVASGRTDAGVHAAGQVVGWRTGSSLSEATLMRAVNAHLAPDVRVIDAAPAADDFHAIRDARSKRYRYQIQDGGVRDPLTRHYFWFFPQSLDADAMRTAATTLLGKHDFSSFEASGSPRNDSVRTILDIAVERPGEQPNRIAIEVEADGFLYNMVRNIVGTLVDVGRGATPATAMRDILAACDRRQAGITAPPQGLCLVYVRYDP